MKVGELVRVRAGSDSVATGVQIVPARVAGYVQSISGSTLTVVDRSGFTHKVQTSGSTMYKEDKAAASFGDIKQGGRVRAQGGVETDGTTVDATLVQIHA